MDNRNYGINPENINNAAEKLRTAIGEEWVSTDSAVLTAYSRDFTIVPGNWPNIVVLPGSTKEVQDIVKIANSHRIPVVPMSTGFNHGGMCIPRKGGIMVDLVKRMDRVLEVDDDSMTITIQPGVRNALSHAVANQRWAVKGIRKLMIPIPLTMGSGSTLSNYFCRGGAATMLKHGNTPESIVGMTLVLPDGSLLKTGPTAIEDMNNIPMPYGVGPDIAGMFINSSGQLGICTEMTIKLYPEPRYELAMAYALINPNDGYERVVEFIYRICQMDICDFVYKSHGGTVANMSMNRNPDINAEDIVEMMPEHIIQACPAGDTREEVEIKVEMIDKIAEECGMIKMASEDFDALPVPKDRQPAIGSFDMTPVAVNTGRNGRSKIGVRTGAVMAGKGSFQWTACNVRLDKIPSIVKDYEKIVEKYWKPTDPKVSFKRTFAGTAIQGPYNFARIGTLEYDYFWDPGNPETVKRATKVIEKANKLNISHGAQLWRNMYGHGEFYLTRLGTYYELLKAVKKEFDPYNLMHPDLEPITDDYI